MAKMVSSLRSIRNLQGDPAEARSHIRGREALHSFSLPPLSTFYIKNIYKNKRGQRRSRSRGPEKSFNDLRDENSLSSLAAGAPLALWGVDKFSKNNKILK